MACLSSHQLDADPSMCVYACVRARNTHTHPFSQAFPFKPWERATMSLGSLTVAFWPESAFAWLWKSEFRGEGQRKRRLAQEEL